MLKRSQQQSGKDASTAARNALSEVQTLRVELDRQTLIVQSLWELLKKKMAVTETELLQCIEATDSLDGKIDGKPTRTAPVCPHCERPASLTTSTCFFCGTTVERTTVF